MLFIGGTGVISAAAAERAVAVGHQLTVLNRGNTVLRAVPPGVELLTADVRDTASVRTALGDRRFDVVADFVAFTPEHVAADIALFAGRTGQYVFISSASAYQKPPARLPIRESTPLRNPFSQYARDKIACEDLLVGAYRDDGFPVTIIRPSEHLRPDPRRPDRRLDGRCPATGGKAVRGSRRRDLPVDRHP